MKIKNLRYLLSATLALPFLVFGCTSSPEAKVENPSPVVTEAAAKTAEAGTKETPKPDAEKTAKPTPTAAPVDTVKARKLTDTAKALAGMKVGEGSPLAGVEKTASWSVHASYFENAWQKLDAQQLSKISKWSKTELASVNQASTPIFYPFSGPDFLYANLFFPNGSDYVMAGLEPVGEIPDLTSLSEGQLDQKLKGISSSMFAILQLSFFRTNDMKVDLAEKGVIPILMVFLARTNHNLLDVQYIGLDKDGKVEVFENAQKAKNAKVPGVKVSFTSPGKSVPQTLYYFSLDLSNEGLQKTPEFTQFVKQFPNPNTYLKAASYLMHNDSFSTIRDFILAQSSSVFQDDSGMPVKYFDKAKWDVKLFGNYTGPIDLFSVRYQPDLRQMYQADKNVKPLTFGIGYKYEVNESNLMLAQSKERSASKP